MVVVLSTSGEFIQIYGFIIYSHTVMALLYHLLQCSLLEIWVSVGFTLILSFAPAQFVRNWSQCVVQWWELVGAHKMGHTI